MYKLSRLAGVLGTAAVIAVAGCAGNSGIAPSTAPAMQQQRFTPTGPDWIHEDGLIFHRPHYMPTRAMAGEIAPGEVRPRGVVPALSTPPPKTQFSYYDGPVIVAPKMYIILWGYRKYGDPDKLKRLLKLFAKNLGGSAHNNIYTQYYEIVSGQTTYITNPSNQFGGIWEDHIGIPSSPSDAQVAAEALRGVKHFGYDPNGSYVVATATKHSSPGFGVSFCAYHDSEVYSGKTVSYTNLPYQPDAGAACGANIIPAPSDEKGVDEGVTIVEGHEYGESITDPVPGAGWYNDQWGEIGDACAWWDIANDPFGAKSYASQPMFSNAGDDNQGECVQGYTTSK
jgi:hypothetical protein